METTLKNNKKIYFVSDMHFGIPDYENSLEREKRFVKWLDEVKQDAQEIYLLGDVFDYWFEYKTVVPRGYVRLFGKLAELTDAGITVNYFTGNHDMWTFGYLEQELNLKVFRKPMNKIINGKKFMIAHGDGLGSGDYGYKFIKTVFASKVCQWLYARFHPNFSAGLALFFSRLSLKSNRNKELVFEGEENERLVLYAKEVLKKEHFDYFIFGHRHIPLEIELNETSKYFNTGDWKTHFSYVEFDGIDVVMSRFGD